MKETIKRPVRVAPASKPWEPLEFDEHDASSMKALAQGKADEAQQKRILGWILRATRVEEQSFVPGGDPHGRTDAFVEGKRAVGNQIWTLLKLDIVKWKEGQALRRRGEKETDSEQH